MDYQNKYIKYKTPYSKLTLQNHMVGGKNKKHGTYADNDAIYSVDLMFMYIDNIKPQYIELKLKDLVDQLNSNDWGDTVNKISPMDVINNKTKYKEHWKRIVDADLKYPIIVNKEMVIIDGMHRLTKAYLNNMEYINAYKFDDDLMKIFVLSHKKGKKWKESDWNYYESLTIDDLKDLYEKRFANINKIKKDFGNDTMEIIFVRHGESTQNKFGPKNEEYDRNNIVLTNLGIEQAKTTGKYIAKVFGKIDAIYHSPLPRCVETAKLIANNMKHDEKLIPNKLLMEANEYSALFDKMSNKQMNEWFEKANSEYDEADNNENPFVKLKEYTRLDDKFTRKINGKPSFNDIDKNYNKFLNEIKTTKYKRILVVCHAGTINQMINILTNVDKSNGFIWKEKGLRTKNCSICCVLYRNNKFELVSFPNDAHLAKVNVQIW